MSKPENLEKMQGYTLRKSTSILEPHENTENKVDEKTVKPGASRMGLPDASGLVVGVNTIDYDVSIRNKAQTREEKKTEMIMKAIDQMEKAEERKRKKGEGARPGKYRRSTDTDSALDANHDMGPSWKRKEKGRKAIEMKIEPQASSDQSGQKKTKKKNNKNVINETGGSSKSSPKPLTSHRVKKRLTARMSTAGVSKSFGSAFKETNTSSASQSRPSPSVTQTSFNIAPPPPSSSNFASSPTSSSNFASAPTSSSSFVSTLTPSSSFVSAPTSSSDIVPPPPSSSSFVSAPTSGQTIRFSVEPNASSPRNFFMSISGITMTMDTTQDMGPPPLNLISINLIPTVEISEAQVSAKISCSICIEDFFLGEKVKQLECDHLFHVPCIDKWLKQNGSCPVCRKVFNPVAASTTQDQSSQSFGIDSSNYSVSQYPWSFLASFRRGISSAFSNSSGSQNPFLAGFRTTSNSSIISGRTGRQETNVSETGAGGFLPNIPVKKKTKGECPMCLKEFWMEELERHAADCQGGT